MAERVGARGSAAPWPLQPSPTDRVRGRSPLSRDAREGLRRCLMPEFEWQFTLVLLTNGVMIGLMYALIALGFVLIYKATDAINFAQGEFVMFAGLIVVTVVGSSAPLLVAVVVVLLAMIAFGFGLEKIVLRPLLGRPVVAVIMATIGVAALI